MTVTFVQAHKYKDDTYDMKWHYDIKVTYLHIANIMSYLTNNDIMSFMSLISVFMHMWQQTEEKKKSDIRTSTAKGGKEFKRTHKDTAAAQKDVVAAASWTAGH